MAGIAAALAAFVVAGAAVAAPQPVMTSIESLAVPQDSQAPDVGLCMSLEDFQAGPGKDFSLSLTLSTPASRVFLRDGEFQFLRILLFGRIGAKAPLKTVVQFSGDRLEAIRLRFGASTAEPDAVDIYDALHDQVLHTYPVAPTGPIFLVEDQKHDQTYARHGHLLLVDKYGDALLLNLTTGGSVTLTYWARGVPGSPGSNAAGVLLGRYPKFCEPVG